MQPGGAGCRTDQLMRRRTSRVQQGPPVDSTEYLNPQHTHAAYRLRRRVQLHAVAETCCRIWGDDFFAVPPN